MPQKEICPQGYTLHGADESNASSSVHIRSGKSKTAFDFTFEAIRPNVFRTTFTSQDHPIPPHPSVQPPKTNLGDVHNASSMVSPSKKQIEVGQVTASVEWIKTPVVSLSWTGTEEGSLHRDLPYRSYVADSAGVAHYTVMDKSALHVGLGEKAAPMDLTGRHCITSATDCFGYDVYRTDPLYKHIPLLIKATPQGCVAMFSTSHSRGTWSVGSEIDGLWGHFKVYRQDYGGLEEYLIVGDTIKEVVRTYAELVGFPKLVPRWAYGYVSGGYKYTMMDDPPAHQTLLDFAAKLKEHDIPCSAHQMSSGYSIAEEEPKVRNVFTWNYHRFPNPEGWIAQYHSLGIRLLANIKPFVLASHPDYQYLIDSGALFTNPDTKKEGTMRLWSAGGGQGGDGCHLDFTSAAAFQWWYDGVQKLKRAGIDAMWNDNNEYTIPNDDWELALTQDSGLGREASSKPNDNFVGLWGRALHTELMGKASHDALLELEPEKRPFVLTRSATPGTMRYASSSWSGDNVTSWDGMKGANAISLTAGMSLLQCYGHDIGGFEGPQPSPELLLRWIQLGIHSPRFAINCFKTSPTNNSVGEVIEPWMYPSITPLIRTAIKRRYEILPYIYSLGLESHLTASPSQRWVGWGYESDPEVWTDTLKAGEEEYWFGDSMLVGGIYEPGVSSARIYLPRSSAENGFDYGYVNMNSPYEYFASGQWVDVASEWRTSIPLLAKVGSAIPVGKSVQTQSPGETDAAYASLPRDDYRGVEIFPPQKSSHGKVFSSTWFEDDGISLHPQISSFTISYSATDERVDVSLTPGDGNVYVPQWRDLEVILHNGDRRYVVSEKDGKPLDFVGEDERGRMVYRLRVFEYALYKRRL